MAMTPVRKRKYESSIKARLPAKKRSKRQKHYDSGSSDESEEEGAFVARDAPRTRPRTKEGSSIVGNAGGVVTKLPPSGKSILEDSSDTGGDSGSELDSAAEDEQAGEGDQEESRLAEDQNGEEATDEDSGSMSHAKGDSSTSVSDEDDSNTILRKKTKRHDPAAFANSLSTILVSKLPSSKRIDPVLSRSREAQEAGHELAEGKLEAKAKRKLREEKRLAGEKGRVRDILLGEDSIDGEGGMSAATIAEQERRLRKTAQRGVVKLFNAVRAAQMKSEEATRQVRQQGVVGEKRREQKVGEMGRNAFLEMVGAGVGGS